MLYDLIYNLSIWIVPIYTAIILHEVAHGYAAFKLGDDTAKILGRVSINPLKHIDILGTLVIPVILVFLQSAFLFGWAKPVPVVFSRLRKPKRDMILVAVSGPAINLIIALLCGLMFHIVFIAPNVMQNWIIQNLQNAIFFNVMLCVFNMLPMPPLDGGRIAEGLLPEPFSSLFSKLERFGVLIVLFVLVLFPWLISMTDFNFNPAKWLLLEPVWFMIKIIGYLSGN